MTTPWPDPNPPVDICGRAGLPIYTNRRDIGWRLHNMTPTTYKEVVIRPCGSCAGMHVTMKESAEEPAPASAPTQPRCTKRRYRSRADAELTMKIMTAADDDARQERRAYPCPQCHGSWHLTSQN